LSSNPKNITSLSKTAVYLVILIIIAACQQDTAYKPKSTAACNKDLIASPHLISVSEVHKGLQENEYLILVDVSPPNDYHQKHLPGAQNVWRPDFRTQNKESIQGMRCDASELLSLLNRLGVSDKSQLIIYDRKGAVEASRLAWVLDYYGYDDYQIMNGGLHLWQEKGLETTDQIPPIKRPSSPLNWIPKEDNAIVATLEDVERAIRDSMTILLDTREPYEYLGQPFLAKDKLYKHKKGAHTHGCIPTARHLNWSALVDLNNDHRLKCHKDLIFNLNQNGVTPEKQIIVYCQSGSRSSHTAFVLRHILGYPQVKNYDGSWIEWSLAYMQKGAVEIEQKTDDNVIKDMMHQLESKISNNNG